MDWHIRFLVSGVDYELDVVQCGIWGERKFPFIGVRTAKGNVIPWAPSHEDILSDNWFITE